METIVYLNVERVNTNDGFLHFSGREGDEEAHAHHINLSLILRWKLLNSTLTVYFKNEQRQRRVIDEDEPLVIDLDDDVDWVDEDWDLD